MTAKGLMIGIDYTDQYCQACYYSMRHEQPESISAGTDVMRYLIPSLLCYDSGSGEWYAGNTALQSSERQGTETFRDLMKNARRNQSVRAGDQEYSYIQLLAVYFEKLLEFIQIRTSVMSVENITVSMKNVDRESKEIWEQVFAILKISPEKVRLLSSAESFGYYMIRENPQLWQEGALLLDFSTEGFFLKYLNIRKGHGQTLIYVEEYDFSGEYSVTQLESERLRDKMDRRLAEMYQDFISNQSVSSVYFTGDGFDEQWFVQTLNTISDSRRAFKGNNLYVKGACIAGFFRSRQEPEEFPIICRGRTRTGIFMNAHDLGEPVTILLSPAARDWYDAGYTGDYLLEGESWVEFQVISLISGKTTPVRLDISSFPQRPVKATRIRIDIRYLNELECEILITDKGFGEFFPGSGNAVSERLHLENYI